MRMKEGRTTDANVRAIGNMGKKVRGSVEETGRSGNLSFLPVSKSLCLLQGLPRDWDALVFLSNLSFLLLRRILH